MKEKEKFRPRAGRVSPRFSGVRTFLRLPLHTRAKDVDVMFLGIPFDGTATYRPGSRFAPEAVRDLSSLGRLYHWEHNREVFASMKACDGGDVFVNVLNVKETHASIEKHIHGVAAAGARPILVGGDHSITLPILRALRKTAKKPIALFHLDAHADTYGPAWGEDLHHGTFVRHAVDEKLIDPTKSVQLGLRGGIADPEDYRYSEDQKFTLIPAQEIHLRGAAWVTQQIQGWKKRIGNAPVYISFDIDGVDPAFAPGTGTPVPGGLSSWQALHVLQSLRGVNLIGADLVEIAPMYDPAQVTSLLAMSILFEMAALMAAVV